MTTATPVDTTIFIHNKTNLCLHTWNGHNDKTTKGLVIIFHGFAAHGLYPTVRYAAERLAQANYVVMAPDLPGHGKSDGLKKYIPSATGLIDVAVAVAEHCQEQFRQQSNNNKLFLLGSSMGGTISLAVAQRLTAKDNDSVTGVVLLAPMLMLSVSTPARYLLSGLASIPGLNTLQLIPSNSTSLEQQYRDPDKRKECQEDPMSSSQDGSKHLRVGSASSCVEMAALAQSQFSSVQVAFLCMVGEEDVVVNNQGSYNLMEQSPSKDKEMKKYPALHGLLCERKPLVDQIQNELVAWMDCR